MKLTLSKTLLIILFLFFQMKTFFLTAQHWSYGVLNEKKGITEVGSIGHQVFFYSGGKVIGGVAVYTNEVEVIDVRTGLKQVFILSPEQIRRYMAVVTSGSKIFFAGGFSNPNNIFSRVDIYDTLTNQWTVENLSQGRYNFAAAAANGTVLFGGGRGASAPIAAERIINRYDVETQAWKDTVWLQSTSLRAELTAASIGDKVFFAGGAGSSLPKDVVNIYDTKQKKWLSNAALSQKKTRLKSIVYHNKIFFVGGTVNGVTIPSDTIDIYDDDTDSWSIMKIPYLFKQVKTGKVRRYADVVQAGCKMFLLPLVDGSPSVPYNPTESSRDSVAVYDFARNQWSYLGVPQPVLGTAIIAAENKVYFAGGAELVTGLATDLISILTLQPKLQSAIENTPVTSYNFGSVLQGEEKAIAVDFSNEGDYELLFANLATRVSISGDVDQFNIDYSSLQASDTLSPAQILSLPFTFNPTSNGVKQVTITIHSNDPDQPIYSFTVQGTGTDVTAVQDAAFSNSLQVYPNPTTGLLHVASKTQESLYIEVLNTQGTRMKETQYISNNETVDLSSLAEGLYFLKIANATSSAVVKVIKK